MNSTQFSNQVAFFRISQLGPFLGTDKTCWCPKDVATRGSSALENPVAGAAAEADVVLLERDHRRIQQHREDAALCRRANLQDQRFSGDRLADVGTERTGCLQLQRCVQRAPAGQCGNGVSIRHAGSTAWSSFNNPNGAGTAKSFPGGAVVGLFGGGAQMQKWNYSYDLINKIPYPNDLFNGPIYRR